LGHKEFRTFSVAFAEGGDFSELAFAREVAQHLGVQHHTVVVNRPAFLEMLPEAVRAADEPLADLTIVPLLAVSRLARERVKVVLSGEGADEVLAGYALDEFRRKIDAIKRIQRLPSALLKPIQFPITQFSETLADKLARGAGTPLSKWNIVHKNHMTRFWTQQDKVLLWSSFPGRDSDSILHDMYAAAQSQDPLDQILYVHQQSWLVEDLL